LPKLVKRSDTGAPIWEAGDNRSIEIDPTPFGLPGGDSDGLEMTHQMSWR